MGVGSGPVAYGLATFGQRAGGLVIDTFLVWVVTAAVFLVAAATIPDASFENPDPNPSALGMLLMILAWFAGPVYYVICEGRPQGQTLGKKALGIRVVRKANGAPLGYGLAIGRLLARFVNFFTLGIGLLWAAWDPQHQALHDKIAGTLVVRSSVYPPPGAAPPSGPPGYQQPAPPSYPYPAG
jgi:uncharacterized RDD family membrane protein YckC